MPERKVTVYERNDPLVMGSVTRKAVDGTVGPLPLGGMTLEFYIKNDVDEVDGDPDYHSGPDGGITILDANNGTFQIQMKSADLGVAGEYRYHMDAVDGSGKRLTVAHGPFIITDI